MFIFDGPNKKVILDAAFVVDNMISFTVTELYSAWVDWVVQGDNLKYPPAFRVLGGDPIGGGQYVGTYLFFRNDLGWIGVPPAVDPCTIMIEGSLFGESSEAPLLENLPAQQTDLIITRSTQVTAIDLGGSIEVPSAAEVANAVWQKLLSSSNTAEEELLKTRKLQSNKAVISNNGLLVTVYNDDGITPLHVFDISADKTVRIPQ